jgi:hypothetical protein
MKGKTYKVDLLPEDFVNANYERASDCALARAMKRHFSVLYASCDDEDSHIQNQAGRIRNFTILNRFTKEDYDFVKKEYENPNHDTIYYVTLKEY